jgi:cell division protein FtsB
MMNEPIPFFGWLQDVEDTEQMLRKQIQIVQAELDRLQQENTALRKQVEAYMSEKW